MPEIYLLLNVWADWCYYSKEFKPKWERMVANLRKHHPHLLVADFNIGMDPAKRKAAEKFGVVSFPSIVLLKGDEAAWRKSLSKKSDLPAGRLISIVKGPGREEELISGFVKENLD